MRVEYIKRVKSITLTTDEDLQALAGVCEAARKWLEFGTVNGPKSVMETQEEIAILNSFTRRVFDAFDEADH